MEAKFLLCLALFCLMGTVLTAPSPTFVVVGPAAAGAVTVSGGGALLGTALFGKALLAKGLLLGALAARRG